MAVGKDPNPISSHSAPPSSFSSPSEVEDLLRVDNQSLHVFWASGCQPTVRSSAE